MEKPRHLIFLIHGISGHRGHFECTDQVLTKIFNDEDDQVFYMVHHLEYETGHDGMTPYEFAKDIGREIEFHMMAYHFTHQDKISLIMHSQGGLVGSIWMIRSIMGQEGYSSPRVIDHLDSFITLGTPFWGAKVAKWGHQIKKLTQKMKFKVPLKFGELELEQMSFGSDMIYEFRRSMISEEYQPWINKLKEKVRFLNIAGQAEILKPLGVLVSGTEEYEDDGAVPLPSARFNFLYLKSIKTNYKENDRIDVAEMKSVDFAPFVAVKALHRSPLPEMDSTFGLSQIPLRCLEDPYYHPVMEELYHHFIHDDSSSLSCLSQNRNSFLIDMNLIMPETWRGDFSDIKIDFTTLDGNPLKNSDVVVYDFGVLYSRGKSVSQIYPNHRRFYFTGQLKRLLEGEILLAVSAKDCKSRQCEIKLKRTYSTFVELNMEHDYV